ncbi:MAG: protoheme IX farnesyltransferase [Acidobacteriaceae bacterium]|nr:protoheme IX farnesyltransferase [Acidobacteriaceae bacterium]
MTSTPALQMETSSRLPFLATVRKAVPDFWTLTKPEVNFLIVIATFTGFYLGYAGDLHAFPLGQLVNAMCGTLLVASGAGALNQYLEYRFDAQMRRTRIRPIAAGRVPPGIARWFGISLSTIGAAYLFVTVNALASALAVFTLTTYLLVYTPLKRKTPLCTLVGAVPGAMPPLIGWAAASGSITSGKAWTLFAVLFLWQFPHVMAIAWMYREDYARAGYFVLPAKNDHKFLAWLTGAPSLALFLSSLAAVAASSGGMFQYSATVILGSGLLYYAVRQILVRSRTAARELLKATIVYLPLEFLILVLGKA